MCVCVSYRSKGVRDNSRRFTHISINVCVSKNDQALAKLEPWTAVSAYLGLISKVCGCVIPK